MAAQGNRLPSWQAKASGKVILFGEHAVVYGQPALAVPVTQVQAVAAVTPLAALPAPAPAQPLQPSDTAIWIDARDLRRRYRLADAAPTDPIAAALRLTLAKYASSGHPDKPAPFALVLTGVTSKGDLPVEPSPDVVGSDLAAVVDRLLGGGKSP